MRLLFAEIMKSLKHKLFVGFRTPTFTVEYAVFKGKGVHCGIDLLFFIYKDPECFDMGTT
jgi:hypothetical protein